MTAAIGDTLKPHASSVVNACLAPLRLIAEQDIDDERKESWLRSG